MKLVALINYYDETDSYDIYDFDATIPFEAASLEEGRDMVMERVKNDSLNLPRGHDDENGNYVENLDNSAYTYFGYSFGEIRTGQTLKVEVITLDQWFDLYKKDINTVDVRHY